MMGVLYYGGFAEEVVTPATVAFLNSDPINYTIPACFTISMEHRTLSFFITKTGGRENYFDKW